MFSGQGSQYFHMGQVLFAQDRVFRNWMLRLDAMAREIAGYSVIKVMYAADRSKTDAFDRLIFSHPAIFMVEYALAQSFIEAGVLPDLTLGASLGSFAAATVSGLVSLADAMTVILKQAETFESHCPPGGMVAILEQASLYEEPFLKTHSELAGINFDTHFVVSAPLPALAQIEIELKRRRINFQRLPTKFAFHSRWIDAAKQAFEKITVSVKHRTGQLPMVCCEQVAVLSTLAQGCFWNIARNPIRFRDAVGLLESQRAYRYIDLGPSGTLATFLKYGLSAGSHSEVHATMSPYGQELKQVSALKNAVSLESRA